MKLRTIFICLLCLLTALMPLAAYGGEIDPTAIVYTCGSEELEIRELQEKLKELGYQDTQATYVLDQNMLYALKKFCARNGLIFSEDGITYSAWSALLYGENLISNHEIVSTFIPLGSTGENVTKMQMRLIELGYYGDETVIPGTYDTAMQHAVEKFCEINHLHYTDTGLNASVQEVLLSDVALSYTPPVPSVLERMRLFLLGHVLAGKVRIPNLLWIVPLYLLLYTICMGFVCLLCRCSGKKKATNEYNRVVIVDETSRTWRHSEINHWVDFQIHFKKQHRQLRTEINRNFTIGRRGCSLNLDKQDGRVSKRHCRLFFFSNVLKLEDVSSYGTFVNEQLIRKKECELHSGDRIQIGDHLLIIRY